MTFLFVTIAWVFFRSPDLHAAKRILQGMAGLNGVAVPAALVNRIPSAQGIVEMLGLQTFLGRNHAIRDKLRFGSSQLHSSPLHCPTARSSSVASIPHSKQRSQSTGAEPSPGVPMPRGPRTWTAGRCRPDVAVAAVRVPLFSVLKRCIHDSATSGYWARSRWGPLPPPP